MLNDPVFWSTFWGGLLSLAVFGVASAALVWLISKITAPFRKKPSWLIETDAHGTSVLIYNRRKPCHGGTLHYSFRGAWADPEPFEQYKTEHSTLHYMTKGQKRYLPVGLPWDEVRIMWRQSADAHAVGTLPMPNDRKEIFTEFSGRRSFRQVLLGHPRNGGGH